MACLNDLPYELWCEVVCHLRNDDILVLSRVTRSAQAATRTVPLTFDVDLTPFRTLLLLLTTSVPLCFHRFVHNGAVMRLTDCVYGLDVRTIDGCVVSRSLTNPECWIAGACVLTRCGANLVDYQPRCSSHARVVYEINRALLDRR